jgi:hypothetical protein
MMDAADTSETSLKLLPGCTALQPRLQPSSHREVFFPSHEKRYLPFFVTVFISKL